MIRNYGNANPNSGEPLAIDRISPAPQAAARLSVMPGLRRERKISALGHPGEWFSSTAAARLAPDSSANRPFAGTRSTSTSVREPWYTTEARARHRIASSVAAGRSLLRPRRDHDRRTRDKTADADSRLPWCRPRPCTFRIDHRAVDARRQADEVQRKQARRWLVNEPRAFQPVARCAPGS